MPCYSPLSARVCKRNGEGRREVLFDVAHSVPSCSGLPCGQCIGCRLERSRQWATRCVHEASLHSKNCFITLTYNPVHLPMNGSVSVREFQLFMKKLRKAYPDKRIRFFHCGEYGEQLARPHYHCLLFGFDFEDKYPWSQKAGVMSYRSPSLEKIWGKGFCLIGDVTFESAAYVARYVMKKITGPDSSAHYGSKAKEYLTMSRRPGIGRGWYDKFKSDVYPSDFIILRGKRVRPPRFYDELYEGDNPAGFVSLKEKRSSEGFLNRDEASPARLAAKEECKSASVRSLFRSMEAT